MKARGVISVFLATLLCASASRAETLNLLIWEDYIDEGLIDRWTEKTGVSIRQINFDSDDARDEILADPGRNIDLVIVDENGATLFGRKGIIEPLSETNLPALEDYAPVTAFPTSGVRSASSIAPMWSRRHRRPGGT